MHSVLPAASGMGFDGSLFPLSGFPEPFPSHRNALAGSEPGSGQHHLQQQQLQQLVLHAQQLLQKQQERHQEQQQQLHSGKRQGSHQALAYQQYNKRKGRCDEDVSCLKIHLKFFTSFSIMKLPGSLIPYCEVSLLLPIL